MGKKPGRPFKKSPSKKREHPPEALTKRKAASIRRARGRGKKLRVVAGTAAARALGIK